MPDDQRPMVICFDDSAESERAVREAARLFPGQRAIVLHVWRSLESTVAYRYSAAGITGALREQIHELEAAGEQAAQEIARRGAELARAAGLDAEARTVETDEEMHEAVSRVVESADASVVVLGSRRLGAIQAIALGGFSSPVVHHSRRPVLVVPSPKDQ